jgi:hypothetical protein
MARKTPLYTRAGLLKKTPDGRRIPGRGFWDVSANRAISYNKGLARMEALKRHERGVSNRVRTHDSVLAETGSAARARLESGVSRHELMDRSTALSNQPSHVLKGLGSDAMKLPRSLYVSFFEEGGGWTGDTFAGFDLAQVLDWEEREVSGQHYKLAGELALPHISTPPLEDFNSDYGDRKVRAVSGKYYKLETDRGRIREIKKRFTASERRAYEADRRYRHRHVNRLIEDEAA